MLARVKLYRSLTLALYILTLHFVYLRIFLLQLVALDFCNILAVVDKLDLGVKLVRLPVKTRPLTRCVALAYGMVVRCSDSST
jgi:hypothetical protein